jgi:anti-sigma regulatory factor (Ser/Thr protein kinase)
VKAGAGLAALARTVDEVTWSTSETTAGRLTQIVVSFGG